MFGTSWRVGLLLSVALLTGCAAQATQPSEPEPAAEWDPDPTDEELDRWDDTEELQLQPRCAGHAVPSPLSLEYHNCPGRPDPCPEAGFTTPPDEAIARRFAVAEGWCSDWDEPSAGGRIGVVFDDGGVLFWRIEWDLFSPMHNGAVCWSLVGSTVVISERGRNWHKEPMSITDGDPPTLVWNDQSYVPCRQFPKL